MLNLLDVRYLWPQAMWTGAARRAQQSALLIALGVLAGCVSAPPAPPALQLELMSSQPLTLAADCEAQGTFRAQFLVLTDGRVTQVAPVSAPDCVRDSLSAWVQSFRYAPTGTSVPVPHAVELLLVNAPRG